MYDIPKILESREKVIWEGKPHYGAYMTSLLLGSLVAGCVVGIFAGAFIKSVLLGVVAGLLVACGGLIIGVMSYERIHYAITNKRAIFQKGIIGRDFVSIDYDKIQNASVDVGLLGVIFKVGTVKIFTGKMESVRTNHGHSMRPHYDTMRYIPAPYATLKKLQERLSKRKEKLYSGKAYSR